MQPYHNLPPQINTTAPCCLSEGLADNHRDRSLAVPRNWPRKIKFVRGGQVENVKCALCGLYT